MKTIYFICLKQKDKFSSMIQKFEHDEDLPDFYDWCEEIQEKTEELNPVPAIAVNMKIIKY